MVDVVIILLLLVIIGILLDMNNKLPRRDYVKEAMKRDEERKRNENVVEK
ncbi:hypothetical protein [Paenibacillus sp. HB172176]|nr:hypothetical protein [Paenibacillus sp. HB172176]